LTGRTASRANARRTDEKRVIMGGGLVDGQPLNKRFLHLMSRRHEDDGQLLFCYLPSELYSGHS
jgi:hypothetical protein